MVTEVRVGTPAYPNSPAPTAPCRLTEPIINPDVPVGWLPPALLEDGPVVRILVGYTYEVIVLYKTEGLYGGFKEPVSLGGPGGGGSESVAVLGRTRDWWCLHSTVNEALCRGPMRVYVKEPSGWSAVV